MTTTPKKINWKNEIPSAPFYDQATSFGDLLLALTHKKKAFANFLRVFRSLTWYSLGIRRLWCNAFSPPLQYFRFALCRSKTFFPLYVRPFVCLSLCLSVCSFTCLFVYLINLLYLPEKYNPYEISVVQRVTLSIINHC